MTEKTRYLHRIDNALLGIPYDWIYIFDLSSQEGVADAIEEARRHAWDIERDNRADTPPLGNLRPVPLGTAIGAVRVRDGGTKYDNPDVRWHLIDPDTDESGWGFGMSSYCGPGYGIQARRHPDYYLTWEEGARMPGGRKGSFCWGCVGRQQGIWPPVEGYSKGSRRRRG